MIYLLLSALPFLPMHCKFCYICMGFSLYTFNVKPLNYTTLTTFYINAFLLHIRITILSLLRYIMFFVVVCFLFLSFFIQIMYHFTTPFRISFPLSQYLPLSIFPCSAFLLFTCTTCLFSSSNHIISCFLCYFQIFFSIPNHYTWRRAG